MLSQLYKKIRLLKNKGKEPYLSIYKITGYYPDDIKIYEQAFLHRSSSVEDENGKSLNNERLEFLGDAILDAIVADIVYVHFPNKKEGYLTNTRSKIVKRETLNHIALELGLDKMVKYATKVSTHNNYIYGNALEALIGAVYLDHGYSAAFDFISKIIISKYIDLDNIAKKEMNFKSHLIEWGQKNKLSVDFSIIESFNDNDGNPVFQTSIILEGEIQMGIGIGYTKKESHQNAAQMALKKLRTDKEFQQLVNEIKKKKKEARAAENSSEVNGSEPVVSNEQPAQTEVQTEELEQENTSLQIQQEAVEK
ncbi:MAG: ribonuclease III [Parabacteroides sp.]|nr:ribonuclease III [Parabacteroides sp.]